MVTASCGLLEHHRASVLRGPISCESHEICTCYRVIAMVFELIAFGPALEYIIPYGTEQTGFNKNPSPWVHPVLLTSFHRMLWGFLYIPLD